MYTYRPTTCFSPILLSVLLAAGCSQNVDLNRDAPQADAAVKAALPEASMTGASREHKIGVTLYEVHMTQGHRELDVTVSAEGQIIEVETTVELSDVPEPARGAIAAATKDATIDKLERVEHRGKLRGGRITMLDAPEVLYEANYHKGVMRHEVQWAADGRRL